MSKLIEKVKTHISDGKKNVLKISSGTIMGQVISMIMVPIMTRIYGATIIGVWTIFDSIAKIGYSISDLALTNALMVENDEDEVLTIYQVVSTISLLISILTGILSIPYFLITGFPDGINKVFIIIYIICAVFTLQQVQICYTWLNRIGKYNVLMKNPVINNLTFGILAIIFAYFDIHQYGYFVSWLLGQSITLLHMKRNLPSQMFTFSIRDFQRVINKHKRFVQYQLPTNIVGSIKNQLPTILIRTFFGTEILGYYSMTVRVMTVPITFLASAMGKVFFQKIAEMKRKGEEIGEYVYRNVVDIMKVGIIPLILILGIGDVVTVWFLGEGWEMAGVFIRIMVVQNFFNFQMNTMTGFSSVIGKQNYALVSCIAQCLGFLVGLSIGKYVFNNVYIGVTIMSLAFVIVQCTYFSMLFKSINISVKKYLIFVLRNIGILFVGAFAIRGICMLLGVVDTF